MADVAIAILQLVAEIRDEANGIEKGERKAHRLVKGVTAIEPALIAVKLGETIRPPPERLRQLSETVERIRIFLKVYARSSKLQRALIWKAERFEDLSVAIREAGVSSISPDQLLETVEGIRNFLAEYARSSKVDRAVHRRVNAAAFANFSAVMAEKEHRQLGAAMDTWAAEDAMDRLDDIENLIDAMKWQKKRNRTVNPAEVTGALEVSVEGGPILRRTDNARPFCSDSSVTNEGAFDKRAFPQFCGVAVVL